MSAQIFLGTNNRHDAPDPTPDWQESLLGICKKDDEKIRTVVKSLGLSTNSKLLERKSGESFAGPAPYGTALQVTIPIVLWERLLAFAEKHHVSYQAVLIDAMEAFMEEQDGARPCW